MNKEVFMDEREGTWVEKRSGGIWKELEIARPVTKQSVLRSETKEVETYQSK